MRSARDLLERAGRSAPSPGFGLDDLERRRDRRRARQRIGTAAVALTLTAGVAGIAFGLAGLRDDSRHRGRVHGTGAGLRRAPRGDGRAHPGRRRPVLLREDLASRRRLL